MNAPVALTRSERRAAVIADAQARVSRRMISLRYGITLNGVSVMVAKARKRGLEIPPFAGTGGTGRPRSARRAKRDADIVRKVCAGAKPLAVARALGVKPGVVHKALSEARARGEAVPYLRDGRQAAGPDSLVRLKVPARSLLALRAPAMQRGMNARDLAALIVETVAEAGLVDAVLDDES